MRDAIVVGLGPAGAATATMLREPAAFGIAGQALDVLAVEARGALPTRARVIGVHDGARQVLDQADALLGQGPTAPDGVATIGRIETTLRRALDHVGADARYGARIVDVQDGGRAGVRVTFDDGSVERARFLVDGTGGRLGTFTHGAETGSTIYLTGQLPPVRGAGTMFHGSAALRVHGAGNDRRIGTVFGFNDARSGATAFVEFPSLPAGADDARAATRLLRRYLRESGLDARGLREVSFISTPHVRAPSAVDGSLVGVGDTVRRVTPRSAAGVSNALEDARGAAWAIHDAIGRGNRGALDEYAIAASRR